jgi:hypothetical protein
MTAMYQHLSWNSPLMKQRRHLLDMRIDMREERLLTRVKVIESWFT